MAGACSGAEPPSGGTLPPSQGGASVDQRWHGLTALSLCPERCSERFLIRVHRRPGMPSVVAAGGGTSCPDPKPARNSSPAHSMGDAAPRRDGVTTSLYALRSTFASHTPTLSATINHELTMEPLPFCSGLVSARIGGSAAGQGGSGAETGTRDAVSLEPARNGGGPRRHYPGIRKPGSRPIHTG